MSHTAERYHDISTGHRVVGHENKCRHLHGHNYRIHFVCRAELGCESLDAIGRVIDFGVIKEKLCMWLEDNWDHKFLAWQDDQLIHDLYYIGAPGRIEFNDAKMFQESIVFVPFNPTAENMARYLVEVIGPKQLAGTCVELVSVKIEETSKCSASFSL